MIRVSTVEDILAISGAATPDRLWRHLVTNPTLRALPTGFEAMSAFVRLHRDREGDAMRTAGLLCTDGRWRRVTAALVADIEDSRILTDCELDTLADGFLWDEHYGWAVPSTWLRDGTVRVRGHRQVPARTQAVLERPVAPPLRRWAAARVGRRRPHRSGEVLTRVLELDARSGDAVMVGLLDGCEAFPGDARAAVVELACGWPSGGVRLRALQLLALDEPATAVERGKDDASAKVRRWAERVAAGPQDDHTSEPPSAGATVGDDRPSGLPQLSLFG